MCLWGKARWPQGCCRDRHQSTAPNPANGLRTGAKAPSPVPGRAGHRHQTKACNRIDSPDNNRRADRFCNTIARICGCPCIYLSFIHICTYITYTNQFNCLCDHCHLRHEEADLSEDPQLWPKYETDIPVSTIYLNALAGTSLRRHISIQ